MNMSWYVVRRLLWALFATFIALSITFGLLAISPNQGEMQAAMQAASQGHNVTQAQELYRHRQGLDEPIYKRYGDYVLNMYTLNWGWSNTRSQPVMEAIAAAWPYSAQYMIPATILSVLVGFGIGLYSAMHQYTKTDYVGALIAFFGVSIPDFWFGIMLILVTGVWFSNGSVFGISLKPLAFNTYYQSGVPILSLANARQLILPTFVISTAAVASQMRYSRAQALEQVNSEYVKTARAKGASEWRVLVRHILRVALVPLVTILTGDFIALIFAGAAIVEIVFQIPGIGLLGYKAIINQDTALIMAVTLIPVFLAIAGNLLQDLLYVWLDPRISYGDR